MNGSGLRARLDDAVERLPRGFSASQLAIRCVGAVALVAAVAATQPLPILLVVTVVAAAVAAWSPEPFGAGSSLFAVVVAWLVGARDVGSWQTVVLALGLLVEHTCLVVAASLPPLAPVPGRVVARAAARAGVVAVVTVLVWAALSAAPAGRVVPLPLVVLALVALVALICVLGAGRRSDD